MVQATSVKSEKKFLKSGLTVNKIRNSLNHESVRCLMCLNSRFRLDFKLKRKKFHSSFRGSLVGSKDQSKNIHKIGSRRYF